MNTSQLMPRTPALIAAQAAYRQRNKARINAYQNEWREANREHVNAYAREWSAQHCPYVKKPPKKKKTMEEIELEVILQGL